MYDDDYIPLTTDDFKIAFCQATRSLCTDIQMRLWDEVVKYREPPTCPGAPQKQREDRRKRLNKFIEHQRAKRCSS